MAVTSKAKEFFEDIEALVWKHDLDYMDAVVLYCDRRNIEVESVANLIKNNEILKSKIQIEAEKLNFLPKTEHLDL